MQGAIGQPLRLESRPGADCVVAAQAFLALPPDGYLVYLTVTSHVVLPFLRKTPFYVIRDFRPVAMIGDSTSLVCVPPDSPADTIDAFGRHVRTLSRPANYLNGGKGTVRHVLPE